MASFDGAVLIEDEEVLFPGTYILNNSVFILRHCLWEAEKYVSGKIGITSCLGFFSHFEGDLGSFSCLDDLLFNKVKLYVMAADPLPEWSANVFE